MQQMLLNLREGRGVPPPVVATPEEQEKKTHGGAGEDDNNDLHDLILNPSIKNSDEDDVR